MYIIAILINTFMPFTYNAYIHVHKSGCNAAFDWINKVKFVYLHVCKFKTFVRNKVKR